LQAEKTHGDKKSVVLYSFVNDKFVPEKPTYPSMNCIVYQGGVSGTGELPGMPGYKSYRYYLPMVKSFKNFDYDVCIFTAGRQEDLSEYGQEGAIVSGPHPYPLMLQGLRMHGMGFVGACINVPIIQAALPNKLFEYISQGVVPVVFLATEAAEFVKEHDCGIVLKDFNNLREQLADVEKVREKVVKLQGAFTMEDQISKIESLYESVL
jgi:hypothetical protein